MAGAAALAVPGAADPFALELERWDGRRWAPATVGAGVETVAFYFGASWCAPCRAFVPTLLGAYPRLLRAARPVELVFVSEDGGCGAQREYVVRSRMPWPMLRCGSASRARVRRFGGPALPVLVAVDREGEAVVDSRVGGRSTPAAALERLLALAERRG